MATQTEVAEHLDLSERRVRDLQKQGVLPGSKGRGGMDLDSCRLAYIGYLRALATGQAAGDDSVAVGDLEQERIRLTAAQADHEELKVKVLNGTLIPSDVVERVQGAMVTSFRARALSMPTKAAAAIAGVHDEAEIDAVLTDLVHEALEEMADFDPDQYAAVPASGEAGPAAAKADDQSVGGSEPGAQPGKRKRARPVAH